MDRPPADPAKLLSSWRDWETEASTPGRVVADLKTGGMRDIIEHLAGDPEATGPEGTDATAMLASWMEWETGNRPPLPLLEVLRDEGAPVLLESLAQAAASGDASA